MRRAVSNIAWTTAEDAEVHALLAEHEVDLEVAPTRLWADPAAVTRAEALSARRRLEDVGVAVVAVQSLLFARPDLTLLEAGDDGRAMLDYLERIIRLAGLLGAGRLVFGSPKARRVPAGMPPEEAVETAAAFFRAAGAVAADEGAVLCIEPNPPAYGCDFVTTAAEGAELVMRADSPGFGLHLDAAGLVLAGDDPAAAAATWGGLVRHVHASAPGLEPLEREAVDHAGFAAALRGAGYEGRVSIEMRAGAPGGNAARVAGALEVAAPYADPGARPRVPVGAGRGAS